MKTYSFMKSQKVSTICIIHHNCPRKRRALKLTPQCQVECSLLRGRAGVFVASGCRLPVDFRLEIQIASKTSRFDVNKPIYRGKD
ncbi:hypothetical protein CEXT_277141 [Caerostris extrusa]|uniref:Uncharacterized protein n=1 Tax=Caerostris extrusa TaxID=172846 RepID=A0AAV4MRN9_CAEEX|nr:hypothetical protein CEXT_277141 [Caerostris extrusa]